jgi:hypothetical protein
MDDQQRDDQLLASAVQFLLDGGDEKAAMILLACAFHYFEWLDPGRGEVRSVTLRAPRAIYELLAPLNNPSTDGWSLSHEQEAFDIRACIRAAFQALINADVQFTVKASLVQVIAHWREELLALLRGERVTNQGLQFAPQRPVLTWNGLRFRSGAEVRIAEALERVERPPVLYLPNCMARLGFSQRQNREADFLICHKGKWGILEVDGPLSHPASRKVDDDERARLFKAHGIRLVEHFDAGDCLEDADGVVRGFLYLLGQ